MKARTRIQACLTLVAGAIFYQATYRGIQMAISRDPKPFKVVAVEASAVDELADSVMNISPAALSGSPMLVDGTEPHRSLDGDETTLAARARSEQAVKTFFDLVIDELVCPRTRAEIESIERAAILILECESRGGRVHVTGHWQERAYRALCRLAAFEHRNAGLLSPRD